MAFVLLPYTPPAAFYIHPTRSRASHGGGTDMEDLGLAALAFAAIAGGIAWVAYFGYELLQLEPPGTGGKPKKEHKPDRRKVA